jgi:hypothetical protein
VKLTKKQAIARVEKALEPHQPPDYRMKVISQGVQKIDGMWYVVVEPSREDIKSYDFNGRLAEAAADLVRQNGEYIQLTTVMPQHAV